MGLLDTIKNVKAAGFDPKKDEVNPSRRLEAGNYPVRLTEIVRSADKANREQLVIKLQVVSGDFKDYVETLFLCFDDGLPEFVLEKNGRILLKLAEFANVTLKKSDLADEEAVAEALSKGIGNQFMMKLTITPNKKDPNYPYRNYDFDALEAFGDEEDLEDDDLPF